MVRNKFTLVALTIPKNYDLRAGVEFYVKNGRGLLKEIQATLGELVISTSKRSTIAVK